MGVRTLPGTPSWETKKMMEIRYFALDDHEAEDTGYDAGPIEVEAENLQYDLDEEELTEFGGPEPPPRHAVSAVLPPGPSTPPPPRKPVAKAVAPKEAASKKAPAKKTAVKKVVARKAAAKKTARKPAAKKLRKR
jgi:hypothetical protein